MPDPATQQLSNPGTASIIAIGSEMLGPTRLDTNSLKITVVLEDFGVAVARKSVVGDRLHDLVDEIRYCIEHADILITSGGLGPTEDDLTREALAQAFGLQMEIDQSIIDRIEKRFAARGWKMPEVNKRQANVFVGQTTLRNERGTGARFQVDLEWVSEPSHRIVRAFLAAGVLPVAGIALPWARKTGERRELRIWTCVQRWQWRPASRSK